MATREQVESLLGRVTALDPLLGQILSLLATNLDYTLAELEFLTTPVIPVAPATPTGFSFIFKLDSIHLFWDDQSDATFYELRRGTVWETADFILRTPTLAADLDPDLVGSHDFLLKALENGLYSSEATSLQVIIPNLGQPSLTNPQIIDNTVLLFWSIPTSVFRIEKYRILRNTVLFGEKTGNFTTIFEFSGGDFTYEVAAVDIAGNIGPYGPITVALRPPPDFELEDQRVSDLSGSVTNVLVEDNKLVCCVDVVETFQEHFDNNFWLDPQEQINAGYPIYIEPTLLTGQYQEEIDYGVLLNNIIISVSWGEEQLYGSSSVVVSMEVRDNAMDPWSSPVTSKINFFQSFRYLRLTLDITGTSDIALLLIYNLTIRLDVKIEMDAGTIDALAADSGGTTVTFNKTFRDIKSLTATAQNASEPIEVVRDFVDVPNPTSFKVLAFDSSGNRINATISWKARGVV